MTILGMALSCKGIELMHLGTDVDGDGIGMHFLGIELDDSLSEQNIPKAASAFLAAGILLVLCGIISAICLKRPSERKR
ncbi:hypothetical protein LCM00_02020 [Bacillus infantis]|uniref:hypothetical protein n=1 Tax=Bacillus infantis TaxID=324767 RepID=UPI001CD49641|nr:hypothetical protein [Bacillus infantis]MCA1038273.1 hypothetical protein [Bacillus infantis]